MDTMVQAMTAAVRPALDQAAVEQARLVSAARSRLLEGSPTITYAMLAEGRGVSEDTARQWVARQRRAGRLITVTHAGVALVPTFQLDKAFEARQQIASVTAELVAFGLDGWAAWHWWVSPNSWLDGHVPVEAADRGDLNAVRRALDGLVSD